MWIVDAAMHVQLGAELRAAHSFFGELFQPGVTQLLFRSVFFFIAVAFGWALWRSNWRERELRALENAIVGFHRRLDAPAMRIVNHARILHGRPGIIHDEAAREIAESISDDARVINELAIAYMRFSEQVVAGQISEATATLHRIEAWSSNHQVANQSFAAPRDSSASS